MRASQWLLGLATSFAIVATVASGCGGSTNGTTPLDSGAPDVTTDHVAEAATPEAASEAAPQDTGSDACAIDASLSDIPDAAIGDAGATTETCFSCIQTNCGSELTACNADCTCKTDVATLITCIASGAGAETCGAGVLGGNDTAATALLECIAGPLLGGSGPGCLTQCGFTLPGDGGGHEGGEAGTAEGGTDGGDGGDGAAEQ
jgi:hypothetical protein